MKAAGHQFGRDECNQPGEKKGGKGKYKTRGTCVYHYS